MTTYSRSDILSCLVFTVPSWIVIVVVLIQVKVGLLVTYMATVPTRAHSELEMMRWRVLGRRACVHHAIDQQAKLATVFYVGQV